MFLTLVRRDLGEAINSVTKAAKCSIVTTYCGHGVGELFHTSPNIPHYPKNKAKGTMQVRGLFHCMSFHGLGKINSVSLFFLFSLLTTRLDTFSRSSR